MIEQNIDKSVSLIITVAVITFFAAVPIGIFLISFIHQSFYLNNTYWYFDSPMSAYIAMVAMLLFIPVMLIATAIYIAKTDETKKRTTIVTFASLVILLTFASGTYLALDNYYFIDEKGITYDELWKFEQTVYEWDDLTEMTQVNTKEGGTLTPEKLVFLYGEQKLELPLSPKLMNEISPVIDYLENSKKVKLVMENHTVD